MATYCRDCDHQHPATRKMHVSQRLCLKFPRLAAGNGFVDPEWWSENEPYMRCVNINGGACPMFTPIRKTGEEK